MSLTKKDLQQIQKIIDAKTLTPQEYDNIKELIDLAIEEKTHDLLATKEDLKNLPSKNEFYGMMDKIMKELKTIREEQTILSDMKRQVNNHQRILEKVGKKLNIAVCA